MVPSLQQPPPIVQNPAAITEQSFVTIRRELLTAEIELSPEHTPIVERMIHSTADFDFATITRFSESAVASGMEALRRGCVILTDVNMIRIGISPIRTQKLGASLHCFVADDAVRQRAQATGNTRSALGIRLAWERGLLNSSIVVIGNAPTALYEVLHLIEEENASPALIIGVPVGFVNVVESKEALMQVNHAPWIATAGRKGGSPVAVAIVNALLRMAEGVREEEID